eukprot:gene16313-7701_t
MSKRSETNGTAKSEVDEWVMLAPSLPALFAFKEEKVFEILKFTEKYRSWFYDDSVIEGGSVYLLTPIDPIFLAIPFLGTMAKTGKFMPMEQIFVAKDFQAGLQLLENCITKSELETICEIKGSLDLSAYKLDTDKLVTWLKTKVEKLADYLETSKFHAGAGAHAANFVKSSHDNSCSRGDYVLYAFELVSDYLEEELAEKLRNHMQIVASPPKHLSEEKQPPAKKQKLNNDNDNSVCVEDYRDKHAKIDKKPAKLTTAQKQLAKIDKTGMKSMNSFFAVKSKKITPAQTHSIVAKECLYRYKNFSAMLLGIISQESLPTSPI